MSSARTHAGSSDGINTLLSVKSSAEDQADSLEEVMTRVLDMIERHPEWCRQEPAERVENVFRELLRL